MNLMIQPNQICLIVKLYNNRPELLPDSNEIVLKMKFQRYCYESDICIQRPDCRHFGKNGIHGYFIGEKYIYLGVSGMPNIYCEFTNNESIPLTEDFLNEWAINTTAFIKETVGVVINPSLTMQVPSIIRNLMNYEDGKPFDTNSQLLCEVQSFPVVSLERDGVSYYVIVDGEPLYDRGITNEHIANDVFKKLSWDIHLYIKKRWPIK